MASSLTISSKAGSFPSRLSPGGVPVSAQRSPGPGVDPIEHLHTEQKLSHDPLLCGREGVHARSKIGQLGIFRAGWNQTRD